MADTPRPAPSIVDTVIERAAQKQRTDLDIDEFAQVANDNQELIERAKAMLESKEQWEALKQTMSTEQSDAANQDVVDDVGSNERLQEIEREIDAALSAAPAEASTEYKLKNAVGNIGGMFSKLSETVGNAVESMGSGVAKFLIGIFEMSDSGFMKGIANWLHGIADPGMIREAMERTLGDGTIRSTPEDRGHTQTLRAQYEAKLAAEKLMPETYSFETFYTQKIAELSARGPKEFYTLADLATIPSAEAETVRAEETAKNEEDAIKVETTKKMTENPNLAYVEAFRDALNSIAPGTIKVVENETIPQIVQRILNAFSRFNDTGFSNFGLEVHSGTLEEADHTGMWNVDDNVLVDWEAKLKANPVGAIRDFLSVDPAAWEGENASAARTFADVRAFMEKRGITPTSITSGKAPEAADEPVKPSAPAAGDDGHDFFPIGG